MKYLVVVRIMNKSGQWQTIYHEEESEDAANDFAEFVYNESSAAEITVLIYELKKSLN